MAITSNMYSVAGRRNYEIPANIRMYSESSILSFVTERANQARLGKAYQRLNENYMDYYRAYRGIFKYNKDIPRWRNRLYVRLTFKCIETLRAYFNDGIFGRTPYVDVEPSFYVYKRNAENMEAIMQHEAEVMRKKMKYANVINSTLKCGVGISRNYWNFQKGIRPVREFVRDENGFIRYNQTKEQWYVKTDSPDFMWIDPVKVAFDPLNEFLHEMRYAVENFEVDFDQLWNTKDFYGYTNLEAVERDSASGVVGSLAALPLGSDPHLDSDYYGTLGETQRMNIDPSRKRVSITRYEGKLDMPGNQEDPRMYEVYIANERHIILLRPSAYSFDTLSYNIHKIIPDEDAYTGISAIETILTDQRILNVLANLRLDSLALLMSPRIIAHKNSFERNINNLNDVAPGGILSVKSLQDLRNVIMPLNIPDTGFSTWHEFWAMQNRHAEETLAMNPNAAGMLAQQRRSATETVRALEGANARFLDMLNYFVESGYFEHTKKECLMIQQFMTQIKQVKITGDPSAGEEYRNITPWDIQGDFMFKRVDPTKGNKEIEGQLWTGLLQAFAPFMQLLQPYGVSPIPFLKGVLEASPVFNKLKIGEVFPQDQEEKVDILHQESATLENILAKGAAPAAPNAMTAYNAGTMPGGGTAPGGSMQPPQPEGTALGIATRGF